MNKINVKILALFVVLATLTSCDLSLQKDYDYQKSVSDPHIDMTAWDFFQTRTDIFGILIDAIEFCDLKDYYTQTSEKYTFLALNNTAIKSYMMDHFPGITSIDECDKETVTKLLLYHIVDGSYSSYGQLKTEPMHVLTMLHGEEGLMTMLVRKNPWQADAGKIIVNEPGSNGNSPMRRAVTSNIAPTNGVIHVFESYCYYRR